uniref:Uncharacterized protein n=1 Tax=Steinernema glaseri TaxID=37863 RepID=A0A1I7ZKH7_9BILA
MQSRSWAAAFFSPQRALSESRFRFAWRHRLSRPASTGLAKGYRNLGGGPAGPGSRQNGDRSASSCSVSPLCSSSQQTRSLLLPRSLSSWDSQSATSAPPPPDARPPPPRGVVARRAPRRPTTTFFACRESARASAHSASLQKACSRFSSPPGSSASPPPTSPSGSSATSPALRVPDRARRTCSSSSPATSPPE